MLVVEEEEEGGGLWGKCQGKMECLLLKGVCRPAHTTNFLCTSKDWMGDPASGSIVLPARVGFGYNDYIASLEGREPIGTPPSPHP